MTWRLGRHYPIHVYEGDTPIATFFTAADARKAVEAVNSIASPPYAAIVPTADADATAPVDLGDDPDGDIAGADYPPFPPGHRWGSS